MNGSGGDVKLIISLSDKIISTINASFYQGGDRVEKTERHFSQVTLRTLSV